ncbi:MAG: hypothetical protein JW827_07425 [Spirochaetes bacterium]|nr:hypothetical protein [Spirochaetota bacterium]
MNFYKGKYFIFLRSSSSPAFIKFKGKDEQYFSANTFLGEKILCYAIQDIKIGKEEILYESSVPFPDFEVAGVLTHYRIDQKINYMIFNPSQRSFDIKIIVTDQAGYIRFNKTHIFYNHTGWINESFFLVREGDYRMLFYLDGQFIFSKNLSVEKKKNTPVIDIIHSDGEKIQFKLFSDKDEIVSDLQVKEESIVNGKKICRTIEEKIPTKRSMLYVPVKKVFEDIDRLGMISRLALDGKFNPQGVFKIISAMKEMNEMEEIKFIKNLFTSDPDIAYALTEEIFDYELLFNIPVPQAREILDNMDDDLVLLAFKGALEKRKRFFQDNISQKRWDLLKPQINDKKILSEREYHIVKQKIGTHVRSFFQKRYGCLIEIQHPAEKRAKIQSIYNKVIYDETRKLYTYFLPPVDSAGYYTTTFDLEDDQQLAIIGKRDKKEEMIFYEYCHYETEAFWEIVTVDEKFIHFHFSHDLSDLQVIVLDEKGRLACLFETERIYQDEIIRVKYHFLNRCRVLIGGVCKKEKRLVEADVFLFIFPNRKKTFFIPEYSIPGEKLPLSDLSAKRGRLFVSTTDIGIFYNDLYHNFIELSRARDVTIPLDQKGGEKICFIEDQEKDFVPNMLHNTVEKIQIFFHEGGELDIASSVVYLFHPVVAYFISYKNNNEGKIIIYNPSQKLCEYEIKIDTDLVSEKGTFKAERFTTEVKFQNYIFIRIKNIYGRFQYGLERQKGGQDESVIDIVKKQGREELLELVKKWLSLEKEYNLLHLLLAIKIAFLQNDETALRFLLHNLDDQFEKDGLLRLKVSHEYNRNDTALALEYLGIFMKGKNEDMYNLTMNALEHVRKDDIRSPSLWIYGKRFSEEYGRRIRYIKEKLKGPMALSAEHSLSLYHSILFTKWKKEKTKIELKPVVFARDFYLERAHMVLDIYLLGSPFRSLQKAKGFI